MFNFPDRDQRLVESEFNVWLARDMYFNDEPGNNIYKYRKYTKAKKIKYTKLILKYLDKMEMQLENNDNGRSVAIEMGGKIRYVWRIDLLSEKEYNAAKEEQRITIGNFGKIAKRDVCKG